MGQSFAPAQFLARSDTGAGELLDAGMYVPTLALQVLAHNEAIENGERAGDKVNIKGIMVGNGVTGEGSIPDEVDLENDVELFFGHALFNKTLHTAIQAACGDYKSPSNGWFRVAFQTVGIRPAHSHLRCTY